MNDADNEQRLRQTLQAYARHDVPDNLDLRRAVLAQLAPPAGPTPGKRPAAPWRPAFLATGLLLGLVVLVLGSLLIYQPPAPGSPPAAGQVAAPGVPAPVRQTQQGYTLTLYPGMMDANWTVLTYTLSSPAGSLIGIVPGRWTNSTYIGPRLSDEKGTELPFIGTLFPQYYNTDVQLWSSPIDQAQMVFRTDTLGAAAVRHLHLDLSLARLNPTPPVPARPWWLLPTVPAAGPFTLDVDVPVSRQARIADVGQTVTAGKVTVRLERVIVTAMETRIFLRPVAPEMHLGGNWGNANYPADATLQIGDWTPQPSQAQDGIARMSWDGTSWVYTYIDFPLLDLAGDWTLTVKSFPTSATGSVPGPWSFHFTLPAAPAPP